MALSATLPLHWTIIQVYFAITLIISIIGWTGLARLVRSRFLALREEEFTLAAKLDGAPTRRLLFRHMLPSFYSHLIVEGSNRIPGMILGETALSFLGLREPAISWGVLVQGSQNVQSIATRPWLLLPALLVIAIVVAFQFPGDIATTIVGRMQAAGQEFSGDEIKAMTENLRISCGRRAAADPVRPLDQPLHPRRLRLLHRLPQAGARPHHGPHAHAPLSWSRTAMSGGGAVLDFDGESGGVRRAP